MHGGRQLASWRLYVAAGVRERHSRLGTSLSQVEAAGEQLLYTLNCCLPPITPGAAKKTGRAVALSVNLPSGEPLMRAWAEKRLLQELQALQLVRLLRWLRRLLSGTDVVNWECRGCREHSPSCATFVGDAAQIRL